MIALLCVDTKSGHVRRYTLQVLAGVRRAKCTDEALLTRPQEDTLPSALAQFLKAPR